MMRWLANLVVVLGCGYLGMVFASRKESRVRQLASLEGILTQMEFNIGFLALPFAEALERAVHQPGVICQLLQEVAVQLRHNPGLMPEQAYQHAVGAFEKRLCLKSPEIEAICEFMHHAGKGDRENTLNGMRLTKAKLHLAKEEAMAECARDSKLYKGLGFITGILLVLWFF